MKKRDVAIVPEEEDIRAWHEALDIRIKWSRSCRYADHQQFTGIV